MPVLDCMMHGGHEELEVFLATVSYNHKGFGLTINYDHLILTLLWLEETEYSEAFPNRCSFFLLAVPQ